MRRVYHIDMTVSPQQRSLYAQAERGPRARTARLMLDTAIAMMQAGTVPSVTMVAEAAGVSRATAYRYFPSQAALVGAVVDAALGPILEWSSGSRDGAERVTDLLSTSLPRVNEFEATFRAALRLSLDQWASSRSGSDGIEPKLTRGHRRDLLIQALAPLEGVVPESDRQRLARALSLMFGIETLIVLKDIWGDDGDEAREVVLWAARALVDATRKGAAKS